MTFPFHLGRSESSITAMRGMVIRLDGQQVQYIMGEMCDYRERYPDCDSAEVQISWNGETKLMTFAEFFSKLGFEEK